MHSRREQWARLERLAKRQEWTVSVGQLCGLGYTFAEIRGLVASGHLYRLHRGVYAVGRRELTRRGWLFAALLACGGRSFLSHRTAVELRGLCPINTYEIHVTVVSSSTLRRSGLIIHRAQLAPHPGEVLHVAGLRASSIYRALIEAAANESRNWLGEMVSAAVRRRLIDVGKLEATIAAHAGARGIRKLKDAFAAYRPRPLDRSGLERAVARAIAADPGIPPPLRNIRYTAGGIDWELDFFWAAERVVLETDGSQYHLTPQDKERDRFKDAKLMAAGITPVRITDVRWELDPAGALQDFKAILGRAARSRRAAPS